MTLPIPYVKTHAYGNDFLLVPASALRADADFAATARRICDRHRGIGADGVMFFTETTAGADTRLFNADGSRAEVSGNGVRCAAAWIAHRRTLTPGAGVTIGTTAGPKRLAVLGGTSPKFEFRADMGAPTELRDEEIAVDGLAVRAVVMRVGNPQCVVLGPATEERLQTIAAGLAVHPFFPEGTNVELAEVEASGDVQILIWERGVGPTEASGTGACAAAVAAAFRGGASRSLNVRSPGGTQRVEWTSETIWLTGTAEIVGRGDWWAPAPEG